MELAIPELLRTCKALADEKRLAMLRVLHHGELSVGELARVLEMAQSGVSRGLALLKRAQLVRSRRQGGWTYLRLNTEHPLVTRLLDELLRTDELPDRLRQRLREVVDERLARSRAFFDGHSERWDELRRQLLPEQPGGVLDALIPSGLTVADLGTGTGTLLPRLVEAGCRVVAIDASLPMLALARRRAQELELTGLTFVAAELERLPLASGTLDATLATLVLHHTARPGQAIAEMARVVRPGGVVVVQDLCDHDQEWLRQEQADQWLGFSPGEVAEWMAGAGLQRCSYRVASEACIPGDAQRAHTLRLFVAMGTRPGGSQWTEEGAR